MAARAGRRRCLAVRVRRLRHGALRAADANTVAASYLRAVQNNPVPDPDPNEWLKLDAEGWEFPSCEHARWLNGPVLQSF